MISVDLTTASQFKIVKLEGLTMTWFPTGVDNNYGQNGEITANGTYTVYFRPNYDGGEDWFNGCIYAALESEAPTEVIPTEPATEPETTSGEIILGDVDGDGEVTSLDATYIQRQMAFMDVKTFNETAADIDGDGEITSLDVTYIQRYLAFMDVKYPIDQPI